MYESRRSMISIALILISVSYIFAYIHIPDVIDVFSSLNILNLVKLFNQIFTSGVQPIWVTNNTQWHQRLAALEYPQNSYDYIVVGSGSAGSVVASRLSEIASVSVLLVEAGGPENTATETPGMWSVLPNSEYDWAFVSEPQKNCFGNSFGQRAHWERGRIMGGSMAINGMVYLRGVAADFDNWARLGIQRWSYADVLPFFMRSEANTDPAILVNGLHNDDGPLPVNSVLTTNPAPVARSVVGSCVELGFPIIDINGLQAIGTNMAQSHIANGNRISTSRAFLEPVYHKRPNLDIMTFSYVTKVLFSNRKKAIGIEMFRFGKKHIVMANKEVILSAGAVQSPHLLLLSGVGPKAQLAKFGIPVVTDLPGVGENLQDHDYTVGPAFVYPRAGASRFSLQSILQYRKSRTGLLAGSDLGVCTANSTINGDANWPDIQLSAATIDSDDNGSVFWPTHFIRLKPQVLSRMYLPYLSANRSAFVLFATNARSRSIGNIELSSSNPFTYPKIQPNHLSNAADVIILIDALRWHYRMAQTNAFANMGAAMIPSLVVGCEQLFSLIKDYEYPTFLVPNDKYLECQARNMMLAGLHPVGSCKMGTSRDAMSVVDWRLRVVGGVSGLRVCDASIMPVIPAANTNAATIMIGERCAHFIKEDLNVY